MMRTWTLACGLVLAACSGTTTPTPGSDSGATDAKAEAAQPDAASDAGPVENDCTTFTDRTATSATRNITWDLGITSIPERCMKVKAGQSVAWVSGTGPADFGTHPLLIYKPGGGPAPTIDGTGAAVFPTAGLYGFACEIHPTMRGAILVE